MSGFKSFQSVIFAGKSNIRGNCSCWSVFQEHLDYLEYVKMRVFAQKTKEIEISIKIMHFGAAELENR